MTDYFALLDFPRRPWIDGEELQSKYHAKTLAFHPDTSGRNQSSERFAEINEAYQTLRDPQRRLQHLLALENLGADQNSAAIPAQVQALFLRVGQTTQQADGAMTKARLTSNALTRGLLQADILRARSEVEKVLGPLRQLNDDALRELRVLDGKWENRATDDIATAHHLQLTFTYLNRWMAQLQEREFQLSQS